MRDRQQILRKLAEGVAHSITPTAPAIRSDTASGLRKINGINTSIVPVKDSSILRPLTGYQYFIRSIVKQLPPRQRTRRFPFEYGAERWRILTDTQRENFNHLAAKFNALNGLTFDRLKVDDNVQSFKAFTQVAPPASVEESVDRWQHLSPQQQESFKLLNIKNTDHVNALKSVRYTAHQLFMREYLQQSWGDPAKKQWTLAMRMADAGNRWRSLPAAEVNDYQRRADLIKLDRINGVAGHSTDRLQQGFAMFAALTFPALRERRPQSTEHQILMNNLQICWRIMSRSQKEVHRSLERRTMTAFSASERGGGSANALIGQCFKWFANRLYGQLSRQNPGWSHYQIMFHLAENWRCLQPQDIKMFFLDNLLKYSFSGGDENNYVPPVGPLDSTDSVLHILINELNTIRSRQPQQLSTTAEQLCMADLIMKSSRRDSSNPPPINNNYDVDDTLDVPFVEPPKCTTAFSLFINDVRGQGVNCDNRPKDTLPLTYYNQLWKRLSDDQRKLYMDQARQQRAAYRQPAAKFVEYAVQLAQHAVPLNNSFRNHSLSPSLPLITSEDGIINNTKIPEDESAGFELFQQHFSLNFRRERRRQLHIKASQTWRRMSQQQKDQYRELARQQQTNRLGQEVKNFNPYAQFIAEFAKRFHIQYSESAESLKAWHKLKEPEKLYFSNLAALKRRAKVKKSFPMQQRESARGFDLFVMGFRHRAITSSSSESEPSRARAIETWHRLKNGGDKQSTGELEEIMQIGRKVWQARRAVSQDTATVANNDTKLFRRNNFFQSVYRWYFAWRVMEELAKIKAAEEQVYIAKFSRILWQIDSEWNEAQVRCAGIHSYANLKSDNCSKVIEI